MPVATQVAVAQIIGQDDHQIGQLLGPGTCGHGDEDGNDGSQ